MLPLSLFQHDRTASFRKKSNDDDGSSLTPNKLADPDTKKNREFFFICSLLTGICIMLFWMVIREDQFQASPHHICREREVKINISQKSQPNNFFRPVQPYTPPSNQTIVPYRIAIGIFSLERPKAPDFLYNEVMSIFDSLMFHQPYILVDKVHIIDGTIGKNGSQVKYFKYTQKVQVHPMTKAQRIKIEGFGSPQERASYNYFLAISQLFPLYRYDVDAYMILEDDVIFDPDAAFLIWEALNEVQHLPLFLVDGYAVGRMHNDGHPVRMNNAVYRWFGGQLSCSQTYLLSPQFVDMAIPMVNTTINGSRSYYPLDWFLTEEFTKMPRFRYYFPRTCWVQHLGFPYNGLGPFHRGCSLMNFNVSVDDLKDLRISIK